MRDLNDGIITMLTSSSVFLVISSYNEIAADYSHVFGEQYRGKPLGKLNSYHHQVSADVFAVDEYTLLLTEFTYDGTGTDTFFWAGASTRPGPQGFIVTNEYGKYARDSNNNMHE